MWCPRPSDGSDRQGAQAGVQAQLVKEFLHRLPGVDLPIALSVAPGCGGR